MQTEIKQVTPVEHELVVDATAEEMASDLKEALQAQRANTDIKGFRPGKVPLSMVKKMYGKALGYKIAEQLVQDAYEEELQKSDLEPIGQPTLTQLNYELEEDLHAVVRFGVRPEIELADLSEEELDNLAHEVSEEDVEEELNRFLKQQADLTPLENEAIGDEDFVSLDLQRIDEETGTPIIGEKEEDVSFFLDDERLKEELREKLLGKKAGATFNIDMPHEHEASEETLVDVPQEEAPAAHHTHRYEVTVKEAKRRNLPELDDDFVQEVTNGEIESEEALREEIRHQLEHTWERQAREFLQNSIVERMLDLHPVPVPDALIETNLDALIEDVKEDNDGELPDDFDEPAFRQANREYAEKQGRWMLIRDRFVEQEGIEVEEEDREQFFADQAGGQLSPEQLRQFYQSNQEVQTQIDQRILGEKVFDRLADRFTLIDKDAETIEEEMKSRQAGQQVPQQPSLS